MQAVVCRQSAELGCYVVIGVRDFLWICVVQWFLCCCDLGCARVVWGCVFHWPIVKPPVGPTGLVFSSPSDAGPLHTLGLIFLEVLVVWASGSCVWCFVELMTGFTA